MSKEFTGSAAIFTRLKEDLLTLFKNFQNLHILLGLAGWNSYHDPPKNAVLWGYLEMHSTKTSSVETLKESTSSFHAEMP